MDINNSAISTSSSISRINLNSALRAFEAPKNENKTEKEDYKKEDINLIEEKNPQKISKSYVDVEDIQKYADSLGEKLTIEDINYGLMYGRSVIADYSA